MIHQCLRLFTSDAFFLLLSNLTGLRLHQLAPEDSDQEDEEEGGKEKVIRVIGAVNEISQYPEKAFNKGECLKVFNPRCRGGFCRWGQGNYTLIRDDDQVENSFLRRIQDVKLNQEIRNSGDLN